VSADDAAAVAAASSDAAAGILIIAKVSCFYQRRLDVPPRLQHHMQIIH